MANVRIAFNEKCDGIVARICAWCGVPLVGYSGAESAETAGGAIGGGRYHRLHDGGQFPCQVGGCQAARGCGLGPPVIRDSLRRGPNDQIQTRRLLQFRVKLA